MGAGAAAMLSHDDTAPVIVFVTYLRGPLVRSLHRHLTARSITPFRACRTALGLTHALPPCWHALTALPVAGADQGHGREQQPGPCVQSV
eukprot:360762-Chlamydomonas_euryale.AAC.7